MLFQAGPAVVLGQHSTTEPESSSCPELASYFQTHTDCIDIDTFSDCSGTTCTLRQFLLGSTASFWIEEKCADPVSVDLSVDGSSPLSGFSTSYQVGGDNLGSEINNSSALIRTTYGRNASHLHFLVCVSVCTLLLDCSYSSHVTCRLVSRF